MKAELRSNVTRRLTTIEGHLAAVRRMIEQDAYCIDILKQTYAIRRAIEKLEAQLLENHLQTCLVNGIQEGRAPEVVAELVELYALNAK
ncbi:MAG: metal-sensitive transcriptional regulator [Chloroflexi bacterium]|nr:metal-sensitive transcriptional regulator [Chloroflexota bacterium]